MAKNTTGSSVKKVVEKAIQKKKTPSLKATSQESQSQEQQRVNELQSKEMQIVEQAKQKRISDVTDFGKMSPEEQMKVLFNPFPQSEEGKVVATNTDVKTFDAVMPKL